MLRLSPCTASFPATIDEALAEKATHGQAASEAATACLVHEGFVDVPLDGAAEPLWPLSLWCKDEASLQVRQLNEQLAEARAQASALQARIDALHPPHWTHE